MESSPAAELCRAVLLARPCLPKLLELHVLELAKRRCAAWPAGAKRRPEGDVCTEADLGDGCPISAWRLSQVSRHGGHGEAPSNVGGIACGGFSYSGDLQTPGVVHLHLFLLLGSILEEAASPGGLRKVPQGWRGERLTSFSICFPLQDYIFYLEPDKLESGKGKCSYDPKVDTVSALISESCSSPGLALPALGRGNMQARWDNCSHRLPALPRYPPGVGGPATPAHSPAADGRAPGMPSP